MTSEEKHTISVKTSRQDILPSSNQLRLTSAESNILKGIALLCLLVHHLFYIRNGKFHDIELWDDHYLVHMIGMSGKVCVSLFVFLSGYGLTAGAEKVMKIDLKKFYRRRLSKLYLNYWLIWILFVPVGIFYFGITLEDAYHENIIKKLLLDIFGLLQMRGGVPYNSTWWFYSCILTLYLLFPFIITACKNKWIAPVILLGSIALCFTPFTPPPVGSIQFYLMPFVLGCYFRNGLVYDFMPSNVSRYLQKITDGRLTFMEIATLLILLMLTVPLRALIPYYLAFDTVVMILIVFCYKNIRMHPYLSKSLEFCGKHSFNIFLFHTFLNVLFIPDLIYWHKNPLVIFITMLLFCLPISVIIEYGKEKAGYYKLLNRLAG